MGETVEVEGVGEEEEEERGDEIVDMAPGQTGGQLRCL